jgi:hypothetical protein
MRINASKADPLFGIREQQSFTESEYAAMADAGVLVEATGKRVAERFGGTGDYDETFTGYANKLAEQAKALSDAAGARDANAARIAISGMQTTCKSCHGVYK